jgi:hypothetical protein
MSQPNSITQDNAIPPQLAVGENVAMPINLHPPPGVHPSPLFAFAETAAAMQPNPPPPPVFHPHQPVRFVATEYAAPSIYLPSTTPVTVTTPASLSAPQAAPPAAAPVTTPVATLAENQQPEVFVDVVSLKTVLDLAGNDKGKALMAMAIGTTVSDSDATLIFDADSEPFASSKTKSQWRPSQSVLRKEINRRAQYLMHAGERTPKCDGWNTKKQYQWLSEHPHTDKDEINWIRNKVSHYKNLMVQSALEKQASMVAAEGPPQPKFNKNEAWMRLTMALMSHRQAFLERDCCLSRGEIEANRGTDPPKTVYQLAAETFNDPDYEPTTPNYVLYSSELYSRKLDYSPYVGTVLTADKVKQLFWQITSQLKVIYTNYQKSGNGDGQHAGEDDEGNNYVDGSDKINFCHDKRGKPMNYVLFFWLYLEESGDAQTNVVQDALSILPGEQLANSASCPKMNDCRKKLKKEEEYTKMVAMSIKSISEQGETQLILSELKDLRKTYNEQNSIYCKVQLNLTNMMIQQSNNSSQYHKDAIEFTRNYLFELKEKLAKIEAKIEEVEKSKNQQKMHRGSIDQSLRDSSTRSIPTTVRTSEAIDIDDGEEDEDDDGDVNELNTLVD